MSKKPSQKKTQPQKGSGSRKQDKSQKAEVNITVPFEPQKTQRLLIYVILAVVSAVLSIYYISFANSQNGFNSFPLDDPWIHLTFAKNLAEYGSFSYFKNEMTTAGSTSPVYTMILAAGFFITKNEMILSYALGIIFLICSVISFYKLSSVEFGKENYFALACTGIFILDRWMNFIADSGMETTMYIFFLILGFYFYKQRKAIPFAIFLGLTFWTRPDAVAFFGAIIIDYIIVSYYAKTDKSLQLFSKNDLMKISTITGTILALYFIMNLILSGSLLPNTYNAKITYYSPEFRSRSGFLELDVWDYFTTGYYTIFVIGFFISFLFMLQSFLKKKHNSNTVYILFTLLLIFIYWYKLPISHRFGRYLMPLIPVLIIVSMRGYRDVSKILASFFNSRTVANGLFVIILAVTLVMSGISYNENKYNYAEQSKYIYDRQVKAALWIRDNTSEDDVIGTHDIGAIGFYSGRKIVDVAGLVTPELISKLNERNYNVIMSDFLNQHSVDYLAYLQEWFRIVNQNPLFSTQDSLPSEVMEVYKYKPDTTVILSSESKSINMYAVEMIQQKNYQQAVNVLNRSLASSPNSSYTYYLLAVAYGMGGDAKNAEINLVKAIQLFPEYKQALLQLGNIYARQGKFNEARETLNKAVAVDPNFKDALNLLKSIPSTTDTLSNK